MSSRDDQTAMLTRLEWLVLRDRVSLEHPAVWFAWLSADHPELSLRIGKRKRVAST